MRILQVVHGFPPQEWAGVEVVTYYLAKGLHAQGHEVTKAMVRMPQGPLKQIGDYPITLDLHADVTVTITVSVLGETVS